MLTKMPVSKQRRRGSPRTIQRRKAGGARARQTQVEQKKAEERKLSPAAYRRRRVFGRTLVVVAIIVGVTHLMEHMMIIKFASPGVEDLVAGFPMAGILGVAGAIILAK